MMIKTWLVASVSASTQHSAADSGLTKSTQSWLSPMSTSENEHCVDGYAGIWGVKKWR